MAPVFNSPQVFPISCSRVRFVLSFFRSCHFYSLLSISLSLSSRSPSLSSIYLSVYPCRSRLLFAVASSQSSFMPPGGEDLITYGEWTSVPFPPFRRFAPLLEILVAWRVLILLPFLFFYFNHLLRFLKILFMRRAWELKGCYLKIMFHDQTYICMII